MSLVIIIIVVLLLFGGLPHTGFHSYGYMPSGVLGVALLILLVLWLTGRL